METKQLRVLAVDDNSDNVQLVTDILEAIGVEVLPAYDGLTAIRIAQAELPDLILLDVSMPGMSGFEVMQHLKGNERTAGIAVIMVTALADVDHKIRGLALGADDYLTKPFNPRELLARIETRMRAKAEADSLREARQMIQATFERFVAPSVVQEMLKNPTAIQLGGKLQEVTVFFADIQGFTSISEHTQPEMLLHVLNQYHALVVEAVQANSGTVDKFIGDGVMALFNTPLELEQHALRAVLSALQIRERLMEFHQRFDPPFRLNMNFGIHTGMAVAGNVGAPQIMQYTAVGDTVNVAARLQDMADHGQILISGTTYDLLGDRVRVNPLGPRQFKNRMVAVVTYEVLGLVDSASTVA